MVDKKTGCLIATCVAGLIVLLIEGYIFSQILSQPITYTPASSREIVTVYDKEYIPKETVEEDDEVVPDTVSESDGLYSSDDSGETSFEVASGSFLTKEGGVNYYNGRRETWYSQQVLPGGGLDIPGRHVDERGIVCDVDGYICVASSDLEYGSLVNTSLGIGKVYDSGCASGTVDIYTNW